MYISDMVVCTPEEILHDRKARRLRAPVSNPREGVGVSVDIKSKIGSLPTKASRGDAEARSF